MARLLLLGMRLAVPASKLLGEASINNVITRVMGIILNAIAVEMVFAVHLRT
jgi:small neutral amino acid transporter SnatA (MarC family)